MHVVSCQPRRRLQIRSGTIWCLIVRLSHAFRAGETVVGPDADFWKPAPEQFPNFGIQREFRCWNIRYDVWTV